MSPAYFEPRVHLQEDVCVCSYSIVCCTVTVQCVVQLRYSVLYSYGIVCSTVTVQCVVQLRYSVLYSYGIVCCTVMV